MKKKIVDAQADDKGNIKAVRFKGNKTFTPVERAVQMAKRGEIDGAHPVQRRDGRSHLRSNPDPSKRNNLDDLAQR